MYTCMAHLYILATEELKVGNITFTAVDVGGHKQGQCDLYQEIISAFIYTARGYKLKSPKIYDSD